MNQLFIIDQNISNVQPLEDWTQEFYELFALDMSDDFSECNDIDYQCLVAAM
jgi:hypothetical protein